MSTMAAKQTRGELSAPAPASKRTRQGASKKKDPVSDSEDTASPAQVVFSCKPLRPAIPEKEADQERLKGQPGEDGLCRPVERGLASSGPKLALRDMEEG